MYVDGDRILDQWLEAHSEDRERWQNHFKLSDDPRVLPWVGRFLRRASLDELPQLWRVLKGDRSLVAPRPLPDYHPQKISDDIREIRGHVPTGLWQVSGQGDNDVRTQEFLDEHCIRNWSPWLDLHILARTVAVVIFGEGDY
jgi:lipopolysaccharide/colanic/teichoic acid biosynthesis glycosyltransferase